MASAFQGGRLRRWWANIRLGLAGLTLAALSVVLLSFPLFPFSRLVLEEDGVAPQDIRAPRSITYESEIRTAEQRQLAEQAVQPVYTAPDSELARQQLERTRQVLDYLTSVRADSFATPAQRRAWVLAVPELSDMPHTVVDGLLALSEESWGRVQLETLDVVAEMMRRGVREGGLESAQEQVSSLVGLDLSVEEAAVTAALAKRLIKPNSFYDEAATQARRQQAREEVSPVLTTFEAGEVIVREGERVSALDLEALRELGLQQSRTQWNDVAGYGALAMTAVGLLGLFLGRFAPSVLWEGRKLLLLLILLAIFLLLARIMVPERTVLRYLLPISSLAMLVGATLGAPVGVAASVYVGAAVGLMGDRSLELLIYAVAGGLMAALSLQKADRPGALFRSALFVALAHMAVLVGFHLPQEHWSTMEMSLQLLAAAGNGVLSASMALGGLFLVGPLFDIITTFRLIELSRPDHPLLQRLLREAPGTYHHSLMVANLAEQAAERIGARPLLTRVGAYYHDIGKIARPYFFIENQVEGVNPHERLDPYTSAEVITGHVRDGLDLARQYRLPRKVRAFIPEHHGTKPASFQYERALELAGDPELVNAADFHHQGPKPQSRETALVMLADSCEAAVRAGRPTTPEELAQIVDSVFDGTRDSGQLDECPITTKELHMAQESFVSSLRGVFHPRIRYPEPTQAPAEEDQVRAPAATVPTAQATAEQT